MEMYGAAHAGMLELPRVNGTCGQRGAGRLSLQGSAERCFSACILPAVVGVVGLEPRRNGSQKA